MPSPSRGERRTPQTRQKPFQGAVKEEGKVPSAPKPRTPQKPPQPAREPKNHGNDGGASTPIPPSFRFAEPLPARDGGITRFPWLQDVGKAIQMTLFAPFSSLSILPSGALRAHPDGSLRVERVAAPFSPCPSRRRRRERESPGTCRAPIARELPGLCAHSTRTERTIRVLRSLLHRRTLAEALPSECAETRAPSVGSRDRAC